jgi:hypothetical protein
MTDEGVRAVRQSFSHPAQMPRQPNEPEMKPYSNK